MSTIPTSQDVINQIRDLPLHDLGTMVHLFKSFCNENKNNSMYSDSVRLFMGNMAESNTLTISLVLRHFSMRFYNPDNG